MDRVEMSVIDMLNLIRDSAMSFNRSFTFEELCVLVRNSHGVDDVRPIMRVLNYLLDKNVLEYDEDKNHCWKFSKTKETA